MAFRIVERNPEEELLRERYEFLERTLGAAKDRDPELRAVQRRLTEIHRDRLRQWVRELDGKNDVGSELARARYLAGIEECDVSLDRPERRGIHAARAREQRARVARLEREERVARERASVERELAFAPWISARSANDPIVPNGCPTCANAPSRYASATNPKQPLSAAAARELVAARFPRYVQAGPMSTMSLSVGQLDAQCGKNAGGCAQIGSHTIRVSRDPSPSLVTHETLHALTAPAWGARVPPTVNESMTEYFNRKLGYFPEAGGVMNKPYEGGQPLLSAYVAARPEREDALARAYFTGDFSALEALEDAPPPGQTRRQALDLRLASWHERLVSRRPGSSLTIDDESLPPAASAGGR